jgi:hypothetical protein
MPPQPALASGRPPLPHIIPVMPPPDFGRQFPRGGLIGAAYPAHRPAKVQIWQHHRFHASNLSITGNGWIAGASSGLTPPRRVFGSKLCSRITASSFSVRVIIIANRVV